MSFPGRSHNLMSLDELSELVKDSVEPLKQKAEQRLDELSVLMKETTQTLNHWDAETDEMITLIHNTRDEHVSTYQSLTSLGWLASLTDVILVIGMHHCENLYKNECS